MKCHKCGATVPNKQILRAAGSINARKRTPLTPEKARSMQKAAIKQRAKNRRAAAKRKGKT